MKKFFDTQGAFLIGAVILGFLLNTTNCVKDYECDLDPIYGGCPSSCDYGNLNQLVTKSFGMYILLNIGSFLGEENLKKREHLRRFLDRNNLRYDIRLIDKEWLAEEKLNKEELDRIMRSMKENKSK